MLIQLDFGFYFARLMRFYSLSIAELREMPLRTFWFLNDQLERIRSEENLALMPVMSCVMGGDGVDKVVEQMKRTVGNPTVMERTKATKSDRDKARRLLGSGI